LSNRWTLELVCAEAFATGLDRFAHTPSRKSFFSFFFSSSFSVAGNVLLALFLFSHVFPFCEVLCKIGDSLQYLKVPGLGVANSCISKETSN
jgi:hypothetical protein